MPKSKKVRSVRFDEEVDRRLEMLLRSTELFSMAELITDLVEMGMITYEYLEGRGIKGIKSTKSYLTENLKRKQLKLPFDKS